jgi:hypothetical protein
VSFGYLTGARQDFAKNRHRRRLIEWLECIGAKSLYIQRG